MFCYMHNIKVYTYSSPLTYPPRFLAEGEAQREKKGTKRVFQRPPLFLEDKNFQRRLIFSGTKAQS